MVNLQNYLYENIPIAQALEITVEQATTSRVVLKAPLHPNRTHKKTVFGGSLHAVMTLSCWSLLFVNLEKLSETIEIVIQKSEIDYLLPVNMDFRAECLFPEQARWLKFEKLLLKKGKAKIELKAQIYQQDRLAVNYRGIFAAIRINS